MKANRRVIAQLGRDDSAVSPVIAVILMVAITVVLAATVYVWVSGFSDTSDQAPSASFKVMDCNPSVTGPDDAVVVKLLSGGPLQNDDVKAVMVQSSDSSSVGSANSVAGSGTWSVGDTVTFDSGEWGSGVNLDSGTQYTLDFIHKPSQQIIASLKFVC